MRGADDDDDDAHGGHEQLLLAMLHDFHARFRGRSSMEPCSLSRPLGWRFDLRKGSVAEAD